MRRAFRIRLRVVGGVLAILALLLIGRLYLIQIIHGDDFALKGERQYSQESGAPYDRGKIYFTRKDGTSFTAAGLESGFIIAINPTHLTKPEEAYTLLSKHLTITHDEFMVHALKAGDPYEEIATNVSGDAGQEIAKLTIPGVIVIPERWRTYPGADAGAQTIGFVSFGTGDKLVGQYGLERYYDDVLERSPNLFKNFFAELFANIGDVVVDAHDVHEGDLETSLEPVVEGKLDEVLSGIQKTFHSRETGGIIMIPSTGEIIALDTSPSFDPNNRSLGNADHFANPLVENVYEFGSIMKPLTMTSGFDTNVITPDSTYTDTGCTTIDKKTFCNFDGKPRGEHTTMQMILSQSLNLGAAHISGLLGHERMRSYFTKLGFGKETGVDLPGEVRGIVNLDSTRDIEYATASFGQGIALTPVQMIRALGTLANGGVLVTPHVGTGVRLTSGITKTFASSPSDTIFAQKSVEETTRLLVNAVDTALNNGAFKIPELSVAAKTGTAQIAGPDGKYYSDRYFHSFMGYFPAFDPKFIILLYTREPQGVRFASETLTAPFMNLVHFLMNYYQLPPDRPTVTSL